MKKRLLCMGLVAVFALSALAFAGCGGEGEKAELTKQLSAVQATVQTQKEELDALKKENADLQKQVDDYNAQIESLEQRLSELEYEQIHAPLNEKTETQIEEDYLRQYGHTFSYDAFYGRYHDCYAFFVAGDTATVKKITVDGEEFSYNYDWEIYVWKEGAFKTLQEAYDANWFTQTSLRLLAEYHKKATEQVSGVFYTLEEAYENGWLTEEDLTNISYYYNGDKFDVENYVPQPLSPASLSEATKNIIKRTYLCKEIEMPNLSSDYVRIGDYYGTYRGCVVIDIKDTYYTYDLLFHDEYPIGGVKFYKYSVNTLRVWRESET